MVHPGPPPAGGPNLPGEQLFVGTFWGPLRPPPPFVNPCYLVNTAASGIGGFVGIVRRREPVQSQPGVVRFARVTDWGFRGEASFSSWTDSGVAGQRWAMASTKQVTGGFSFNYDWLVQQYDQDILMEGVGYRLALQVNENHLIFFHNVLITAAEFVCDVATGGLIGGRAEFVSSGTYRLVHSHTPVRNTAYGYFRSIRVNSTQIGEQKPAPPEDFWTAGFTEPGGAFNLTGEDDFAKGGFPADPQDADGWAIPDEVDILFNQQPPFPPVQGEPKAVDPLAPVVDSVQGQLDQMAGDRP